MQQKTGRKWPSSEGFRCKLPTGTENKLKQAFAKTSLYSADKEVSMSSLNLRDNCSPN